MSRIATTPALVRRARQYAPDVELAVASDGAVEAYWFRHHGRLRELCTTRAATAEEALRRLIIVEAERARTLSHGEDCSCEDCMVARIDFERAVRGRKP